MLSASMCRFISMVSKAGYLVSVGKPMILLTLKGKPQRFKILKPSIIVWLLIRHSILFTTFPQEVNIIISGNKPRVIGGYLLCAKSRESRWCGIRLESKPVSYSWFPAQVGPQVSNPGLWD
jgi:hypothetical protein